MNRPQRIVLIVYCLVVAYCCLRVPSTVVNPVSGRLQNFIDYWLWNLPVGIDVRPNVYVVGLRLLAITAMAAAGFLAVTRN